MIIPTGSCQCVYEGMDFSNHARETPDVYLCPLHLEIEELKSKLRACDYPEDLI